MKNERRKKEHQKHSSLEILLEELEDSLSPVELNAVSSFTTPDKPTIFIAGCARSGSTLLLQYLAESNNFQYPSNLLSRFFFAPFLGYKIEKLLCDFDYKGEIFNSLENGAFTSHLGKTTGAKSPHEFWYFWRRFFKFGELQQLSSDELKQIDTKLFLSEIAALSSLSKDPLVMKAMILNWHLDFLAKLNKQFYILYIKRDLLYNAQSLLKARENFFGNLEEWYSFKPPNYPKLKSLSPEEQVINQVLSTNSAIENSIAKINPERVFEINYETFCSQPISVLKLINERVETINLNSVDSNLKFTSSNHQQVSDDSWQKLNEAKIKFE